MKKRVAWLLVFVVLFFGGWIIKDTYADDIGRALMGTGLIVLGVLIIRYFTSPK